MALGILGATKKVLFGIDNKGKCFGKFNNHGDIYKTGDIGAAAADKDADARRLSMNIELFNCFFGFSQGSANIVKRKTNLTGRRTGLNNRRRYILGRLNGAANKDARARCPDRMQTACFNILIMIQIDA